MPSGKQGGAKQTKLMQQHALAKRAHPDAILFFRLGDFYEMFGDDAVVVARELNLTLTSRNKGDPDEIPMAGVPHHAAHGYIGKLLQRGYQVAICEQMADPKLTKGIVPREVVRVLTPGLITHDDHLVRSRNNWLAAIELGSVGVGICLLDISTCELRAATVANLLNLLPELCRESPREVLLGAATEQQETLPVANASLADVLHESAVRNDEALLDSESDALLAALGNELAGSSGVERLAIARALRYARRCNPGVELPLPTVGRWDPGATLKIDENAQRHLELVTSMTGKNDATLLGIIDETKTAKGARLLRRRLLAPLRDVAPIRRRHDRVQAFLNHATVRERLRELLDDVTDFERVVSRCQLREGSPRDLGQLRTGLLAAASADELLQSLTEPDAREALELAEPLDLVGEVADILARALVERPPAQAKEGAIFRPEFDSELTELEKVRTNGTELVVALETRLKEETGISTLKVRFTRVFGWYVEVSRSYLGKVPQDWRRKQTVAGGERYSLTALDELGERIASAEELHRARELQLLRELTDLVVKNAERVRLLALRLAEWDVDAALAEVAHRFDYVRPLIDDSLGLQIEDGRHPVVERLVALGRFVPNDVSLDADGERLWVITGPNMAGKSTFLRQVALTVILAQMGSFVPAKRAHIGLCDRVLSRVGASDNLAQGQSTFMVEMKETADILRYATDRSLVILDEIGRGTSTFDGLAIAWAVAEHLDQVVGCRALFATHYHEMTRLADDSEHVANYSVSARERDGDIVFLHRVIQGAASRSYGVSVAKLAGLPEAVLARARALLALLEGDEVDSQEPLLRGKGKRRKSDQQLALFGAPLAASESAQVSPQSKEILDTLKATDVERLTPLEALQLIVKLKKRL